MNSKLDTQPLLSGISTTLTAIGIGLIAWMLIDQPRTPDVSTRAIATSAASTSATPVDQLATDSRKKIEDIQVGDLVWAYNEETGQLEKRRVAALFRSVTDHMRVLTLQSETGNRQRIETTGEHPFWVVDKGWREARFLRPGDALLSPDRSVVELVSTLREEHPEGLPVYNFEVEGLHDYFVSATARDSLVLSHNMCQSSGASRPTINPQKQAGHVPGTPQHANRVKQGKPTSTFYGERSGEMATQIASQRGTPVPGRPNVKEYEFGVGVGIGPNGGTCFASVGRVSQIVC